MKSCFAPLFAAIAALSIGNAHAQVSSNQIYNGLVSYWPMDQLNTASGVTTTPDVVSGINLTAVGGPTSAVGQFGNAIALNGTSQYLVNTNTTGGGGNTNNLAAGLPYFAGTPFTLAFWVKAAKPTSTTHYVFAMGDTTNATPLYCLQSGSTAATEANLDVIIRQINNSPPVNHASTTNVLFDGVNWHHLAWVDSNGVVSVYQDGVLESGTTNFGYLPDTLIQPNAVNSTGGFPFTCPLNTTAFGALVRNNIAGYFSGTFDDAAIWNRALSQAEIQYVMNNSIAQPVPALAPNFAVPLASQTNSMGDYVVLSANVCGTPPLSLQWYENGSPLLNATNPVLDLYNLTSAGTNVIYVTASNPNGTVTNGPMKLVVLPDAAPELSIGCYGYWPMDTVNVSGSSVTTPDLYQGNNFNLTNNMSAANEVPSVSGAFTNALDFNNSASVTNIGYLDGIIPAFNWTNYTISFWVNAPLATAQTSDCAFGNTSSSSGTPLVLLGYSDTTAAMSNLCVYLRSDQGQAQLPFVLSSNGVFDGTWHRVTWVDKGGSVTLYVDGTIDPVCFNYIRTNASPPLRPVQTWSLTSECLANRWASKSTSFRLNCEMDDVAWWNRPLSYTEVQMLQTSPVPGPTVLTPPVIGVPPASLSNAYVGDTVTFNVTLSAGSPPLTYQWYFSSNGITSNAINASLNPTASTAGLVLNNIQLTNAGYYSVVVSNGAASGSGLTGGGVTNSAYAQLIVHTYSSYSTNLNNTILQLEFNAVSAPGYVQPGYQSMTLASGPAVFNNTTKVTVSPLNGGILADRSRNVPSVSFPTTVSNNPPALTTALLYNSFIFNGNMAAGSGIDILIQHLAPNTTYGVNIWSFDPDSASLRVSDWIEAVSSTTIDQGYSFNNAIQPTADWQDTFGALLTSDPNGQLDIQGSEDPGFTSQFGVFINALNLTVNPLPVINSAVIGVDGNLVITAQAQYSGQNPVVFQESPDLINWQNASDVISTTQNGPIYISEFPFSARQMFYRAVYQPLGPQ
jgi:hypothetical protein